MGMRLPTVEEAEVIAQRILDIRNALDITDQSPSDQSFWTATQTEDNRYYYINFNSPFTGVFDQYIVSCDEDYCHYFSTFIKH